MSSSYTTIQGDLPDQIAKKVYGDEKRIDVLLGANPQYADIIVFSAGTVLVVPDLPGNAVQNESFPPWRVDE